MRQLDIFWIILLVFDLNPAAADPEKCHEVEKLKLVGYIHVCTCVPAVLNLGNEQKQSVLDFSKADPRTMNDFFGKKQDNGTDYCFTNIHGSVIINGNNQLDIVNFGEAINWHSKGGIFLDIRNNANLKQLTWKQDPTFSNNQKPTTVYIYNNPLMDDKTLDLVKRVITNDGTITSIIQGKSGECWFEDPIDGRTRSNPDPELLEKCTSIKGDLIVVQGKITNNMELSGGCLRLIKTDMTGIQLEFSAGKGAAKCKDANFVSAIEYNPNLCDAQFEHLKSYFPASEGVSFKEDPVTCGKTCTTVEEVTKISCKKITIDADISRWFTDPLLDAHRLTLAVADGNLTIQNSLVYSIKLPQLVTVKTLFLINNTNLAELDLPKLAGIDVLKIHGSPRLFSLENMRILAHRHPFIQLATFSEAVHCTTSSSTIVEDLDDLRLCTVIDGPLRLENIHDDNITGFAVQEIKGCVSITNTTLKDLSFLVDTKIHPSCKITVTNNPDLCPLIQQLPNEVVARGTFDKKCRGLCPLGWIARHKCFEGVLKIPDDEEMTMFEPLEIVYGSIAIVESRLTILSLPNLAAIHSSDVPALRISGNSDMDQLYLPQLTAITVAGKKTPVVEVKDNDKLKLGMVNVALNRTGISCDNDSKKGDLCSYQEYINKELESMKRTKKIMAEDEKTILRTMAGLAAAILGTIGLGVSLYFNVKLMIAAAVPEAEGNKPTVVDIRASLLYYQYQEPAPFMVAKEMAPNLVAMMDGLFSNRFLPLRYKFHHGIRTADNFPNEKMNFNRNVHFCCDEYLNKLPEFIRALEKKVLKQEKMRQEGGKDGKKKKPKKQKKTEDSDEEPVWKPVNPNRIHLLHFGRGFLPTLYHCIHGPQFAKITTSRIFHIDVLARPHIDLDHFVTSTLLDIHFYNSRGEKMLAAVELTEIHIDYEFREQLLKNTAHRWMDWIFSAVKRDDIIQTDCGEAYLMIYFTISTIDLLIGVYGRLGKSQLANFPLSMYETYMQLYRGRDKVSDDLPTSGKDAWLLWANYMIVLMSRVLKDTYLFGSFDPSEQKKIRGWGKAKLLSKKRDEVMGIFRKWRRVEEDEQEHGGGGETAELVGGGKKSTRKKKGETAGDGMVDYGRITVDGREIAHFTEERDEKMAMPGGGMRYWPTLKKEWNGRAEHIRVKPFSPIKWIATAGSATAGSTATTPAKTAKTTARSRDAKTPRGGKTPRLAKAKTATTTTTTSTPTTGSIPATPGRRKGRK